MNPEEQDVHQRGDSDDEIAELRFQALLTKKENEAEVSPARSLHPYNDSTSQMSMNQPLSNYQGNHQYNYRGRGRGSQFYKPYLQTFSQQIASNCVNSNNIVVLTSSDADDEKQAFPPDWARNRRGHYGGRGGRWPRGGDRGVNSHAKNGPTMPRTEQPPPPATVVHPQEKYASPNAQDATDNKAKLSARMRRLQGPDSDSEDSESDSSSDSSSSDSSSDSNSSSSDSSSSGSDSDSDNSQETSTKRSDKAAVKRPKGKEGAGVRPPPGTTALPEAKSDATGEARVWTRSPNKSGCPPSKLPPLTANSEPPAATVPDAPKNVHHSPPYAKGVPSRSPSMPYSPGRRRSPPGGRYSRSPPPRRRSPLSPRDAGGYPRRLKSDSRSPRRYSPPLPRGRSPSRRYGTPPPRHPRRSCSPPIRVTHSPIGRGASSKLSPPSASKYSPGRYRSRSPVPPRRGRAPRSPGPRRTRSPRSPMLRRLPSRSPPRPRSRSPLSPPKRYSSRSPLRPRRRYGSPTPPPPHSRSPYSQRGYGGHRGRRSRTTTPPQRRYRSITPRGPWSPPARSRSPRRPVPPLSPGRRKRSYTPPRYGSRSPLGRGRAHRSPIARSRSPFSPPHHPKRLVSPTPPSRPSETGCRDRSPPFPKYGSPRPLGRYGSPPPLRKGRSPGAAGPPESLRPRSPSYSRNAPSPYRSRSPPPATYYRSRTSSAGAPNLPSERSIRTQSQSPPYYGSREVYIARGGRGAAPPLHYNEPAPKRYPMGGDAPWPPHKSEPYPHTIYRHPPPSHYPPKFAPGAEGVYGVRGGHAPPPQGPPQLPPDKHWPLLGPPGRPYDSFTGVPHFGGRGGGPRFDRFPDNNPSLAGGGRGRGMRGHRGHPARGVHSRLGNRVPWPGPHQGPPLGPHDPVQYGDPYIREKFPPQRGPHPMPPMEELEPAYMDRKPPLLLDPPKMHPGSPPPCHHPQRVPRGPKTPPYSPPKRDPSPFEWQKRDRTPSLSPSPSRRYDKEEPPLQRPLAALNHRVPLRAPSRERGASLKRYGSQGPREVPAHGAPQYRKDDVAPPSSSPAHNEGKMVKPPRGDAPQDEAEDRKKGRRIDEGERHPRDPPPRKAPSSDSHKREEDRGLKRGDERRRTPPSKVAPRPKGPQNGERHEDSRGRDRRPREGPEDHRKMRDGRKRSREEDMDGLPPRVVREATHDGDVKRRREREVEESDSRAKRDRDRDRDRGRDAKAKYEQKEDSKEARKEEREEEAKRRLSKEEVRSKATEERASKEDDEGGKKREAASRPSKDDLDEDAKRKKKKQHKDADKKSAKHKKEKKRKKKKKDSKKKKKSHKGSDTEELTPRRKKKTNEGVGREGNDLRHLLIKKGDGSPMRRRKDSPVSYRRDEEVYKRRRRDDTHSGTDGKDWKGRVRSGTSERDGADGTRRKDGRPHIQRERNHIDDHSGGGKGLLVTVGSGTNRQVTSGSSSTKSKGGSSKERLPILMRLGPGNEDTDEGSGGSKGPKKGSSRLCEGSSRRKGSGGTTTGPRHHQSPRRIAKGPNR